MLQDSVAVPSTDVSTISATDSPAVTSQVVRKPKPKTSFVGLFSDTAVFSATKDSVVLPDTTSAPIRVLAPESIQMKTTNLYGKHALVPIHRGPLDRDGLAPGWLFPIVLFVVAVFTWLKVFYSRYFQQMMTAVVNTNLANQIVRDENILVQRATVYLSLLFYIILSLFLYVLSFRLGWDLSFAGTGFTRFLFFSIAVSAIYAFKFLILKFCGWLFDQEREFSNYLFTVFISNNMAGILLFPLVVVMAFNPGLPGKWLTIASIAVLAAFYGYRLLRGVMIGWAAPGVKPLYLIFYLCTLELAPLSVLLRLVTAA